MTDADTNVVLITRALERYPAVFNSIRYKLEDNGIDVEIVEGTKNIWLRDWCPCQVGDHYVKFRYVHDEKRWPQLAVPDSCWDGLGDVRQSNIVLDGGNVVQNNGTVLMTEIVFGQNPHYSQRDLIDRLEELLEAEIIFLPVEPGDDLGHADGLVKWIGRNAVFVNDYQLTHVPEQQEYGRLLRKTLIHAGIESEPFPFAYQHHLMSELLFRDKFPDGDAYCPAVGYYVNILHVGNTILYPRFDCPKDQDAERMVKAAFPQTECHGIECRDLAMEGGLLRCVTAQYKR